MPPGNVLPPDPRTNALTTGFLERYDIYELDDQGVETSLRARIPVLNAQNINVGDFVVFDVFQHRIDYDGHSYFIPIAIIPDEFDEPKWGKKLRDKWDEDWGTDENAGKAKNLNDSEKEKRNNSKKPEKQM